MKTAQCTAGIRVSLRRMSLNRVFCLLGFALSCGAMVTRSPAIADEASPEAESLPPGKKVVRIEVFPASVELKHPYAYRQVILTGELESGEKIDVTRMASVEAPATAKISPQGLVRPAADGSGELRFTVSGQSVKVPVAVNGTQSHYAVSFVRDVAPALSKLGCNAGTCHGSAEGKNGFKLSLRGYDPLFDHRALTDDLAGRRVNRAAPDQSLMLLKISGSVPHMGGVLTRPGEPYYNMLRSWIADGESLDRDAPRVKSLEVFPKAVEIPLPGMKQQLAALATYSDGSVRDVTAEAFVDSSLGEVVEMDKHGLATAVRRGEAALLARYEGAYAAATCVVMGDRSGFVWSDPPANNQIDTLVYNKLQKIKVLPSELCTDAEFVRRVYLDLTGVSPGPDEVRAFMADAHETKVKRDELIDRLIGSPDFVEYWTNKWADLLQVNRKFLGEEGAWAFRNWIRQAVAANMPYDRFVYTVLTAQGSTIENPPAAYMKVLRDPGEAMENTTQLFLAVRFNCNKCHDHPFERWTQDQYYHMASYFAQVGRKPDPQYAGKKVGGTAVEEAVALVEVIFDKGSGDVQHIRTGQVASPSVPYQSDLAASQGSRREQLARWITSKDNQYFAKSYVNRIWSYLLGAGIIEPVDDIRAGNPPSNPELLVYLTDNFIRSGFDVRHVFREICRSRVYQRSLTTNQWNADDDINYSHALARRLPAEVLYDAVHSATGSTSRLPEVPVGFRAMELPDSAVKLSDGFFDLFGRPARESACECERSSGVILGQALNLVNGPTIAEAITDPENRLTKLVASEQDDKKVIEEIFISTLCRQPSEEELRLGLETFQAASKDYDQAAAALTDFEQHQMPGRLNEWEKSQSPVAWTPLEFVSAASGGGATLAKQQDGSLLVSGTAPEKDSYTVVAKTDLAGITGIRLEVLADDNLPAKGPGRAVNGNFVLNDFRVAAPPRPAEAPAPDAPPADGKADVAKPQPVPLARAVSDFSQGGYNVAGAIDADPQSGWAIDQGQGRTHTAIFETKENLAAGAGTTLTFTLDQNYGQQHTLGRFRLSVTAGPRPLRLEGPPEAIQKILAVAPGERTDEQGKALAEHFRTLDQEYTRLAAAVKSFSQQKEQHRLIGAQDLAWALINSPAFLFNR